MEINDLTGKILVAHPKDKSYGVSAIKLVKGKQKGIERWFTSKLARDSWVNQTENLTDVYVIDAVGS
jgi:hypothetical protein